MSLQFVEVTDAQGQLQEPMWLAKAEAVHRQLRPKLSAEYTPHMQRVFAGGARLVLAAKDGAVLGLALWRCYENTYNGMQLYVDDLVTEGDSRSEGVGKQLLAWLEAKGKALGAQVLALDSGTQRVDAHRFYLRERMQIVGFHFTKPII